VSPPLWQPAARRRGRACPSPASAPLPVFLFPAPLSPNLFPLSLLVSVSSLWVPGGRCIGEGSGCHARRGGDKFKRREGGKAASFRASAFLFLFSAAACAWLGVSLGGRDLIQSSATGAVDMDWLTSDNRRSMTHHFVRDTHFVFLLLLVVSPSSADMWVLRRAS
jgi:hypothetical protein